jgi:chemotaxis response regulator CheB
LQPLSILVVSEGCAAVEALCAGIKADGALRLAGRCRTVEEAQQAAVGAAKPDVAVLDLHNFIGIHESLQALKISCNAPLVALDDIAGSALVSLGAEAADFVLLPSHGSDSDVANFTADALERIKAAYLGGNAAEAQAKKRIRLLAVACAQGGPVALACLLSGLSAESPAVLVLQRKARVFTKNYAALLSEMCSCGIAECRDGMELESGKVYLACECGITIEKKGEKLIMRYEAISADALFASAAESLGEEAACVLLSGSGMEGLERAAALGALAIAQNKNALLREPGFQLPGGVLELPLEDIAAAISPCTGLSG